MIEWLSLLGTSVGLGAGAGLNSYATLLVFGLISRLRPELFPSDAATFFATTPVLIVLGVLYTAEFVADKIPTFDHVWDAIHTFIRPVAGAFVAIAATSPELPKGAVIFAGVLAGGTALGGHLTKASIRAASTATTAGTANPILSVIEDLLAVIQVIIGIFLPIIMLILAILFVIPAVLLLRRWLRRRAQQQLT